MSHKSSLFHKQIISNLNMNFTQPPLISNSKIQNMLSSNSLPNNNYQNNSSSILMNKEEEINNNSKDIQILEKQEKNNEIELNITLKYSESKSKIELLKISVNQYLDKQSKLLFEITSPNDPLFLYTLELSEIEYPKFKSEQSLLVDFKKFPDFVLKMLTFCKNDKEDKYTCILNLSNGEQNNINLGSAGVLIIEEITEYRKMGLLTLKLQKANDINLKKYLSNMTKDYKEKYESLLLKFNELKKDLEICQKEKKDLSEDIKKNELNHKIIVDSLKDENNKIINEIKENNLKENISKIETLNNESKYKINDLENKIIELQNSLEEMTKKKAELEEKKMKLEYDYKDLDSKLIKSNTEVNIYKTEISNLKYENSELNKKCLNDEKQLNQFTFKIESLEKQIDEKNKSIENMKQLIDTLNKQRDSSEDKIKSLKANNTKLENKLQLSIKEISKANDIIQKLESEFKNLKNMLKSSKIELNSKNQEINQNKELLDEQNNKIVEITKEKENKDKEIHKLKNEINEFNSKINDYQKLIEENKEMILYLNKSINENINNPFRARYNFSAINYYNNLKNSDTFNLGADDNIIENNENIKANINIINNTDKDSIEINNYSKEKKIGNNNNTESNYQGNNFNNSFESNKEEMIFPKTNYSGYQFRDRNKTYNNMNRANNLQLGYENKGSLLAHRYGNTFNEGNGPKNYK